MLTKKIFFTLLFISYISSKFIGDTSRPGYTVCLDVQLYDSKQVYKIYPLLEQYDSDYLQNYLLELTYKTLSQKEGTKMSDLSEVKSFKLAKTGKYGSRRFKVEVNLIDRNKNTILLDQDRLAQNKAYVLRESTSYFNTPNLLGCFFNDIKLFQYNQFEDCLHGDIIYFYITEYYETEGIKLPRYYQTEDKYVNIREEFPTGQSRAELYRRTLQIFQRAAQKKWVVPDFNLQTGDVKVKKYEHEKGFFLDNFSNTYRVDEYDYFKSKRSCFQEVFPPENNPDPLKFGVFEIAALIYAFEYNTYTLCKQIDMKFGKSPGYHKIRDIENGTTFKDLFKILQQQFDTNESFQPLTNTKQIAENVSQCDNYECIIIFCFQIQSRNLPEYKDLSQALKTISESERLII